MTASALLLVILAGVVHAVWNLMAKRAADAGAAFVLACNGVICVAYGPWALWLLATGRTTWNWAAATCIALSALANLAYALCLQRGYRVADLSVVYPVARGTGPLLASVGGFLLLGETPTSAGLAGLLLVVLGVAVIATQGNLSAFQTSRARSGVFWGSATGALTACYSVVDAWGVQVLGIAPIVLVWLSNVLRFPMLAPVVLRDHRGALRAMHGKWMLAIGVGLLAPLSYIIVLMALSMGAPLSLVAPARETSMMAGALLGLLVLREPVGLWRWSGCALLTLGVVALAMR